jgi:hypothetical protein
MPALQDEGMRVVVGLTLFAASLAVTTVLFSGELSPPVKGLPPKQALPPGFSTPPSPPRAPKHEPKHDVLAPPPDPEPV